MLDREDVVERAARELRHPVEIGDAFDARVMSEIARPEPRPRGAPEIGHWLARPRVVRVSPLGALVAAAGFAALIVGATLLLRTSGARAPVVTGDARVVQFVFAAPTAASVALVGDFNDWDARATPMHATQSGGLWSVDVPIKPGRHLYAFIVDGTLWRPDPSAPPARGEDFGEPNSVVTVGETGS